MRFNCKIIALLLACVVIANFTMFGGVLASAHSSSLDVTYDYCDAYQNEKWYVLESDDGEIYHIDHEENTIKYYFEESSPEGTRWDTDISQALADEIMEAYANSMKKWNDVYFYSYDAHGRVVKNKIINIVEGTATDHNLSIYPKAIADGTASNTDYIAESVENVADGDNSHIHASDWIIYVNLKYFYANSACNSDKADFNRERTGAHEVGHILGLRDIDYNYLCGNTTAQVAHHEELLMGYGEGELERVTDITYMDLAGVAITRGLHTDNDHKWLYAGQEDGEDKLICSICNGVRFVEDKSNYSYNVFLSCESNHSLSSGNMMAVGSNGDKDYYKCKYCKYVAPLSSIVSQNYSVESYSDVYHIFTNNVEGLTYTFLGNHQFVDGVCTVCEAVSHTHSCASFLYFNRLYHKGTCSCGEIITDSHSVRRSEIVDNRYARCIGCNHMLDLTLDNAFIVMGNARLITANGSYILPNGIVVLEDSDVEAYLNGTLVFYENGNVIVSE